MKVTISTGDSPQKLATVWTPDEYNNGKGSEIKAALEKATIDFSWSNKPEHRLVDIDTNSVIQLLVMKLRAEWLLANADEVWLLIDRYKPKKGLGNNGKYKASGFHHEIYPSLVNPNRPSEILITNSNMILNINAAAYFNVKNAKGIGTRNNSKQQASFVLLQFRLKVKSGENVFYSQPKNKVKIFRPSIEKNGTRISFKLA